MYDDLQDLYQQLILDHYRKPRNRGPIAGADRSVELKNPLCGDEIGVDVKLAGERIADIHFRGHGCSISQSSASMMTELLKGKTEAEARERIALFKKMMRNEGGSPDDLGEKLGDVVALHGVPRKFAQRIKCASLAWLAAEMALDGKGGHVDTDGEGNVGPAPGAATSP